MRRLLAALILTSFAPSISSAQTSPRDTLLRNQYDSLLKVQAANTRYCNTSSPTGYMRTACILFNKTMPKLDTLTKLGVITVPPPPPPDTVKPPVDTVKPPVDTVKPPPVDTIIVVDSFPTLVYSGVKAELPRAVLKPGYPTNLTQVKVPLIGNLQFYLDNNCGKEILLSPGTTYTGNFIWKKLTCNQMTVLRTDTTSTWTRTTPSKSASLRLAKIVSPNNAPALYISPTSTLLWIDLVEITNTSMDANMLIHADGGTSKATVPTNIHVTRSYVHGTPTMQLRRALRADMCNSYIAHNWISENQNSNTDAQAILGLSGACNLNIVDNYLDASHEVILFGGGDPADSTMSPRDITIRGNHITRPTSWRGQWQVKNLVETKNVTRLELVGNVIENNWPAAQTGYAFVMKSENQDGTAPYTTSSDITIRWNKINCVASVFNFAGKVNNAITASRFTVYQNHVTNVNVAPCNGDYSSGVAFQLINGITDLVAAYNTIENKGVSNAAIMLEGAVRLSMLSNVMWTGGYGIKGSGAPSGTGTLEAKAPGYVFTNNSVLYASCGAYPATTNCNPATIPAGTGVDSLKLNSLTRNVVVAP